MFSIQVRWKSYQELLAHTPPDSELEAEVIEICGGVASDLLRFFGETIYDAAIHARSKSSASRSSVSRYLYSDVGDMLAGSEMLKSLDRKKVADDISEKFTYQIWFSLHHLHSSEFNRHFIFLLNGLEQGWKSADTLKSTDSNLGELLLLYAFIFQDTGAAAAAVQVLQNYRDDTHDELLRSLRSPRLEWAISFLRWLKR